MYAATALTHDQSSSQKELGGGASAHKFAMAVQAGPSMTIMVLCGMLKQPVHGRLHIVTGPHSAANSHSWQLKLSAAATLVAAL